VPPQQNRAVGVGWSWRLDQGTEYAALQSCGASELSTSPNLTLSSTGKRKKKGVGISVLNRRARSNYYVVLRCVARLGPKDVSY
jgi:hypothetical protein